MYNICMNDVILSDPSQLDRIRPVSDYGPYIPGGLLREARRDLREAHGDPKRVLEVRQNLFAARPERYELPENDVEACHLARLEHMIGDTYSIDGDFESAAAHYDRALYVAGTFIENSSLNGLYQALLHVSLADLKRLTLQVQPIDQRAIDEAREAQARPGSVKGAYEAQFIPIYEELKTAMRLLSVANHAPMEQSVANLISFFAERARGLTAVLEGDLGFAQHAFYNMEIRRDLVGPRQFLQDYTDPLLEIARERVGLPSSSPKAIENIDLYTAVPMSVHFAMPDHLPREW